MNAERFFRGVWRANALVILVAGSLGIALLALGLWFVFDEMKPGRVSDVAALSENRIVDEQTRLLPFQEVEGTRFLRAELIMDQDLDYGPSGKGASAARNVLFFDRDTQKGRWLVPDRKRVILETRELPYEGYGDRKTPVRAFLYTIVERDTDGSGQLTGDDLAQLAVSGPTGRPFSVVVPEATAVLDARLDGDARLLVFYRIGEEPRIATVDLATGSVASDGPLVIEP